MAEEIKLSMFMLMAAGEERKPVFSEQGEGEENEEWGECD